MHYPYTSLFALSALAISACNSGGSNSSQQSNSSQPTVEDLGDELSVTGDSSSGDPALITDALTELPMGVTESGGAGLVIETNGDCAVAGDPVTLALFSRDAEIGIVPDANSSQTGNNVTAFTSFSLGADSADSGVDVISHTDTQLELTIPTPDIVSITGSFADNSVTDFIAAWPVDAPDSAVLIAERDNGVCLYSLRLPDFCGTTRSTGAASQVSFGDQVLAFSGCEIIQVPDLPVLRIN